MDLASDMLWQLNWPELRAGPTCSSWGPQAPPAPAGDHKHPVSGTLQLQVCHALIGSEVTQGAVHGACRSFALGFSLV